MSKIVHMLQNNGTHILHGNITSIRVNLYTSSKLPGHIANRLGRLQTVGKQVTIWPQFYRPQWSHVTLYFLPQKFKRSSLRFPSITSLFLYFPINTHIALPLEIFSIYFNQYNIWPMPKHPKICVWSQSVGLYFQIGCHRKLSISS